VLPDFGVGALLAGVMVFDAAVPLSFSGEGGEKAGGGTALCEAP